MRDGIDGKHRQLHLLGLELDNIEYSESFHEDEIRQIRKSAKKNIEKKDINIFLEYDVVIMIALSTNPQGKSPKIIPMNNPLIPNGFKLKFLIILIM